jgi:hypothetical protein
MDLFDDCFDEDVETLYAAGWVRTTLLKGFEWLSPRGESFKDTKAAIARFREMDAANREGIP